MSSNWSPNTGCTPNPGSDLKLDTWVRNQTLIPGLELKPKFRVARNYKTPVYRISNPGLSKFYPTLIFICTLCFMVTVLLYVLDGISYVS